MVLKARTVFPSEERALAGQGHEGTFWMIEMFHVLTWLAVTQI